MKKIKWIIAGILFTQTVHAQQVLTMQQIGSAIKDNNPVMKMLDASARSMTEAAKGAYSWMPPELGVGLYQTPYNSDNWKSMNGQPGMGAFMISAQQMFPNKRAQDAQFRYMNAESSVMLQQKAVAVNELLYTARKNYYDWIVLEKKMNVLDENSRLLQFMMQSAEIRYKNGLGKIGAYYKAKAALSKLENRQLALTSERERRRIAINTVMNRKPGELFQIDTGIVWQYIDSTMFDTTALMERRSDIKLIGKNMEVNSLERKAELAALRPEFGVQYNHMTGWANQPLMFSAMAMVKLPMAGWSSRMHKAKAESLSWQNEALVNQQQMIINEATGMAGSAYVELQSLKQQMAQYEQEVIPALLKNFQTMQLGYEQNTEELFKLFDAWEALYTARMEYLDQLQAALEVQAGLMKIMEVQ